MISRIEFTRSIESFFDSLFLGIPNLLGALLILLIGWLIAKAIKSVTSKLLSKTRLERKIASDENSISIAKLIGNIVYYVIMVIVLLVTLEKLGVSQVLTPLENLVDQFVSIIPNIIAAGLIGFIGYMLAKFVSDLVQIGGTFLDKLVEKTGIKDTDKFIKILKNIVFIIIFVPILVQALNVLNLEIISNYANIILYDFMDLLGLLAVSIGVLFLFGYVGKFLTRILEDILRGINIDKYTTTIGIKEVIGEGQSLAKIIANLAFFFIMFFGVITASEILNLYNLTDILNELLEVTGQIIFGIIILIFGNYISKIVYDAMLRSDNNKTIANIVRYASLALFFAIALRTMGIANSIVELAFGLTMGAIAVAIALSYGLGGREAAGEHFREIIKKLKSNNPNDRPNKPVNPTKTLNPNKNNPKNNLK